MAKGGITGDSGDLTTTPEAATPQADGTSSTISKYIKIDVPDFNNTAIPGGSGQGSMRSYLRLGAIEQAESKSAPFWGPSSKVGKGATPATPNAADLQALIDYTGGLNPLLWSTVSPSTMATYNAAEFLYNVNTVEANPNAATYGSTAYGGLQALPGYSSFGYSYAGYTATSAPSNYGNTYGPAGTVSASTVGLVIPGQLAATMIQSGSTGSTGDPFLQILVATAYDSTGEDLAGLVKGFLDDSRMRSDAGATSWWGGAVRIDTPYDPAYQVAVGVGPTGFQNVPQGIPAGSDTNGWPLTATVDSDLTNIKPAPFFMPTWSQAPVATPPAGHPGPGEWADFGNLVAGGATGVDWSMGGFPAPTDAPAASTPNPKLAPFVQGWMIPIRLGGPSPSTWGAQATPNTTPVEGPLWGWDPHPAFNSTTPDWAGGLILTPGIVTMGTTLPQFAVDADGSKLGSGVPLDPRDPWGMTPLPGYGTLIPASVAFTSGAATGWDSGYAPGNINAVSNWLAMDYRAIESTQLHTKGGWRDHTDGNRVTTTRGDKVEVIRGNYKLIVIGRQDGSKGAGFDMGGGGNDSFTTGAASTDPSTLASITEYKLCDDGQYRSWSTTKKGSGVPKLGGDGITVTLPTGSVQVAETWGWKSYTYTGVEKLKILSGGSGPPTGSGGGPYTDINDPPPAPGSATFNPNNWFGPVMYLSGPAKDPTSYIPFASNYGGAYTNFGGNDPGAGFAAGPAFPIAGPYIFNAKGGLNDDTRGMIWPVAETISESHTTKTYSATFVRDTVSITAGPMLTVPFSLKSTTGAGMILPWPDKQKPGNQSYPLQLPPSGGAVPKITGGLEGTGDASAAGEGSPTQGAGQLTMEYDIGAPQLDLDAFGAFPLKKGSFQGDGGLPSDYPHSTTTTGTWDGPTSTRMALEGTGIPIPGQPYQKVNSTTAETHVKTQIARTYADQTFAQSFVGKAYTQSGTPQAPNDTTNSLTWVNTTVAESHTIKSAKSFTFVNDSHTESTINTQYTKSVIAVSSEGHTWVSDQTTESKIGRQVSTSYIGAGALAGTGVQNAPGQADGFDTTLQNGMPGISLLQYGEGWVQESHSHIGGNTFSTTETIGNTLSITNLNGSKTTLDFVEGVTCALKVNASVDLSVSLFLMQMSFNLGIKLDLAFGAKTTLELPVKAEAHLTKAQLAEAVAAVKAAHEEAAMERTLADGLHLVL